MQKDGQISENDLEEITKRLAVGEELKASLAAKEAEENGSNPPPGGNKREKLSNKIAKSKAKTREMFERARAENFEEFSVPPSEHPASMFPEPEVLESNSPGIDNRSHRRMSRSRTKGWSSSRSRSGEREAEQTQEDLNQSLEEEHKRNVKKEKEKSMERRRRREAREIPQPPVDPTSVQPNPLSSAKPWLSKLDPPKEPSNLDKAIMAKEEGNDYFRNKNYDFALQQYTQAIRLCPRDAVSQEEEGKGEDGSGSGQGVVSENSHNLATFLGNRAAAYFMLECWEECETDCNLSLHFQPNYSKVLMRRCMCLEKQEKFEAALADAHAVQQEDPTFPRIAETVHRLQKAHEKKMNELKDEALGKFSRCARKSSLYLPC